MAGDDAAIGPVENEHRLLISRWERTACSCLHGGRRSFTDVCNRQRVARMVEFVGRPTAGAASPAEVRSGNQLVQPGRAIPRCSHVEFRIGVVRKQLAVSVEVDAERVPQAGSNQLPVSTFLIRAEQVAFPFWFDAARISQRRSSINDVLGGNFDGIAMNAVNQPVRSQCQVVATVSDSAGKLTQQRHFVEPIVTAGILQSVHALRVVGVRVKGIVRVEQTAAFQQRVVDRFDFEGIVTCDGKCQTKQAFVFTGNREPSLRIESHADPRSFLRFCTFDSFDREPGKRHEACQVFFLVAVSGLLPLRVIIECRNSISGTRSIPEARRHGSETRRRLPRPGIRRALVFGRRLQNSTLPRGVRAKHHIRTTRVSHRQSRSDCRRTLGRSTEQLNCVPAGQQLIRDFKIQPGTIVIKAS